MFVSVRESEVSTTVELQRADGDGSTMPSTMIPSTRKSSRKRVASTRYDADCFTELGEEHVAPEEEKSPKTPQEKDALPEKKRKIAYDASSDEEYVPGEDENVEGNASQCSQDDV